IEFNIEAAVSGIRVRRKISDDIKDLFDTARDSQSQMQIPAKLLNQTNQILKDKFQGYCQNLFDKTDKKKLQKNL
ncbi:MAG: hypothetical protein CMP10_19845, partial [Zetaproteobacteria bacterium]|nr:hypothetical protein [Pseudobdellovibrionaceae bacterium]